jgi:hypothetical protein
MEEKMNKFRRNTIGNIINYYQERNELKMIFLEDIDVIEYVYGKYGFRLGVFNFSYWISGVRQNKFRIRIKK